MSKFLDKFGLEHYHDLIKAGLFEYIEGTQSSATSTWTGVSTQPGLFEGKLIIYHLPYAGASAVPTLNLTLPDGTTTGAKTVGSKAGTFYAAGNNVALVYTGTTWEAIKSMPIDIKELATGAISTVVDSNLTAGRAVVSNASGKIAASATTANDLVNVQKANLFSDEAASLLGLNSGSVPNDAFLTIGNQLVDLTDWTVEKITTSQVWTAPKALNRRFKIFGVGGGGAGGVATGRPKYRSTSGYNYYIYTGGGGGGGYVAISDWVTIPAGTQVTVVCGAGGTAVNGNVTVAEGSITILDGGNGGTSSFGTYCTANGGYGGSGANGGNGGGGGGAGRVTATGYTVGVIGNGGNGGTYGGGGGTTNSGTRGTGGTYGGHGGKPGTTSENGTAHEFSVEETIASAGGTFSTTGTAGTNNTSSSTTGGGGFGGRGGHGGSARTTSNTIYPGGGGGGFGGNGGDAGGVNNIGEYSICPCACGGGGNYGGNGGDGGNSSNNTDNWCRYNGGGGGGLLCDGAAGSAYCGGGGGGIVDGNSDGSGGAGGFYVLYKASK